MLSDHWPDTKAWTLIIAPSQGAKIGCMRWNSPVIFVKSNSLSMRLGVG